MSTPTFTRADVERAEPLSFDRKQKQDLTITVACVVNGFTTEITFSGQLEQLDAITKRLRELGAEPVSGGGGNIDNVNNSSRKPRAERVSPEYKSDGTPCCPVHHGALAEGQYGWYCRAKARPGDVQNDKGYCSIRFAE